MLAEWPRFLESWRLRFQCWFFYKPDPEQSIYGSVSPPWNTCRICICLKGRLWNYMRKYNINNVAHSNCCSRALERAGVHQDHYLSEKQKFTSSGSSAGFHHWTTTSWMISGGFGEKSFYSLNKKSRGESDYEGWSSLSVGHRNSLIHTYQL